MGDNKILEDLLKVYIAQTESALQISEIISNHGGEDGITPDSFVTGLIYRLMVPMD